MGPTAAACPVTPPGVVPGARVRAWGALLAGVLLAGCSEPATTPATPVAPVAPVARAPVTPSIPTGFDPALLVPARDAARALTRAWKPDDPTPPRVALDVPPPWREAAVRVFDSPLVFVARDAEADMAVVLLPAGATPDGWQRALPPAEVVTSAPNPADAGVATDAPLYDHAYLWRRRLPPEALVRAARPHHPATMGLRRVDRMEAIPHAGSPALAQVDGRLVALFVRAQALWRAESADEGATWSTPAPVGIDAVDPALVAPERVGEPWRLFAVTFPRRDADPVAQDTEVRSWTSTDLRTFTPEPGVRLAGRGLLDPTVARTPEGWEMWLTAQGTALARATSTDGSAFTRAEAPALTGFTVPELSADGRELLVQARVADRTGVYVLARSDALAAPDLGPGTWSNPARPVEGCGTGATLVRRVGDAHPHDGGEAWTRTDVWVSDHAAACGAPYVWPGGLSATGGRR
jgi:hypothetical protein